MSLVKNSMLFFLVLVMIFAVWAGPRIKATVPSSAISRRQGAQYALDRQGPGPSSNAGARKSSSSESTPSSNSPKVGVGCRDECWDPDWFGNRHRSLLIDRGCHWRRCRYEGDPPAIRLFRQH